MFVHRSQVGALSTSREALQAQATRFRACSRQEIIMCARLCDLLVCFRSFPPVFVTWHEQAWYSHRGVEPCYHFADRECLWCWFSEGQDVAPNLHERKTFSRGGTLSPREAFSHSRHICLFVFGRGLTTSGVEVVLVSSYPRMTGRAT